MPRRRWPSWSRLDDSAAGGINAGLSGSGLPIDLAELKPQHIGELIEQLDDVTVDVDDPDGQVRVFCE
ncbi:hypothetical protein ACFXPV_21415 [Streptomyces sp. NPDC059118]|uniref:hypothetical protein n=1 Tax=unclassified Streptomyces TaxID=2593676 RepID=UPI0036B32C56